MLTQDRSDIDVLQHQIYNFDDVGTNSERIQSFGTGFIFIWKIELMY